MLSEKNAFRVRLMRWGDSSSSGRTVTFKLPDDTDEHPFKGLPVGAKAGQLLEMEVVLIEEDGDVETLSPSRKSPRRSRAPLPARPRRSSSTVILPNSPSTEAPDVDDSAEEFSSPEHAPPVFSQRSAPPLDHPTDAQVPTPTTSPPLAGDMRGSVDVDGADIGAYAGQMGMAAEALATVAEKMTNDLAQDDQQFVVNDDPAESQEDIDGRILVARASSLCKAVDNHRSGFFYFMQSLYPNVTALPPEDGQWTRDSKATRDRVCHHCETSALDGLAKDDEARRRFEELETKFERSERFR